jgi:sRNA-binding regulator protein Hfq
MITKPATVPPAEKPVPPAPAKAEPKAKVEPPDCDAALFQRAKRERRPIKFKLFDGTEVNGMVINWSRFSVMVEAQNGAVTVVFKHGMLTARLLGISAEPTEPQSKSATLDSSS